MDCANCGTSNPPQARFCLSCGAPLTAATAAAPREERKVVSVLFADLVGFTARAETLDPEDVDKLLRPYHERLRSEIERRGGVVEKFIGDAVMAVFGAPIAREDDAERAVRAALAIRDWARESEGVELRVAVNTGEALVSVDARPELGQSMVKGDVVNTAARLQSTAPVNAVLVGEPTYRATSAVFDYETSEPVVAKGKAEPVPAWEPLGARTKFGVDVRQIGRSPLVGRQPELEVLLSALGRARSEREPQLVTLVAVPGMGKSRLVWELFQHADAEKQTYFWRQGRSLPYGEGVSFWALGEMVKAQAGILESDDAQSASAKVDASVAQVIVDESQRAWVSGHLRPLVGLGGGSAMPAERGEAFAAWRRYLEALAERQPLILVFEDLHWADDGMLDFVDYLAEWASGVPILLVGTARPELLGRRPGWGGGKSNAQTLSLTPLSEDETTKLVHSLLGQPVLSAEMQRALLDNAGGNPLYAEEFVRLAQEGRGADSMPESVHAIIAARLDTIEPDDKRLIQAAAVLGKVFWLGGLANVAGRSRWGIEDALHRLERREFVRRERTSSVAAEAEYAFRHALIRDAAYEQLPRSERAEHHRRAAVWLESLGRPEDTAEMLAHHYHAALDYSRVTGQPIDDLIEPAKAALATAGERAQALNSFGAAERHFRAALELSGEHDPDRPLLVFGHARALHSLGDPAAGHALEEASSLLATTGDREHAAEVEVMLAESLWHAGNRVETDRHLALAGSLISGVGRTASRARVLTELSRYHMVANRRQEAIDLGREALDIARQLDLPVVEAHALDNIGVSRFYLGDMDGIADVEESLRIALAADSPEAGRSYNNLAVIHWLLGDTDKGDDLRALAAMTDERYGRLRLAAFAEGVVITSLFYRGRWDEFVTAVDRYDRQYRSVGRRYPQVHQTALRAIVEMARGQDEAAVAAGDMAAEWAREGGEPQMLLPSLSSVAFLQYEMGATDAARDTYLELVRKVGPTAITFEQVLPTVFVGPLGIEAEFERLLAGAPSSSKWLSVVKAAMAGDFALAADMTDKMGMVAFGARLRLESSRRLAAVGRRADADAEARRALAFWRSVRATRYINQTEDLLSKAG